MDRTEYYTINCVTTSSQLGEENANTLAHYHDAWI